MTISEKVAYLKGLAEGLDLDTTKSKEGKLISVMIGILEELAMSVEDLEENALNLGEEIDVLSDDLADVEEVVFDEDEDSEDYDDDWFEVECPTCGADILVDDDALVTARWSAPPAAPATPWSSPTTRRRTRTARSRRRKSCYIPGGRLAALF